MTQSTQAMNKHTEYEKTYTQWHQWWIFEQNTQAELQPPTDTEYTSWARLQDMNMYESDNNDAGVYHRVTILITHV